MSGDPVVLESRLALVEAMAMSECVDLPVYPALILI